MIRSLRSLSSFCHLPSWINSRDSPSVVFWRGFRSFYPVCFLGSAAASSAELSELGNSGISTMTSLSTVVFSLLAAFVVLILLIFIAVFLLKLIRPNSD